MSPITTNILRASYDCGQFCFGGNGAGKRIVLIGSCRIVPFLNYLRVYNSLNGDPFELGCFNPVEMWTGPGNEVSDGVNNILKDYRLGETDFLVCEHVQYCGVLNTVRSSEQNIFDSLGCNPAVEIRLPNFNDMHIFDLETAMHDRVGYANLSHPEKVAFIKGETAKHKARFLSHCRGSSLPELEAWVESNWLTTRLGWSSSHPSRALLWRMFEGVAEKLGIEITPQLESHPLCLADVYQSTGIALTDVDFEANGWKF